LVNVPPIGTKDRGVVLSLIWAGAAWVVPAKTVASRTVLVASLGMLGWKCRLGARYFGGGVTAVGEHLLGVNGTGIAGH